MRPREGCLEKSLFLGAAEPRDVVERFTAGVARSDALGSRGRPPCLEPDATPRETAMVEENANARAAETRIDPGELALQPPGLLEQSLLSEAPPARRIAVRGGHL